jgi:hypothetical protein
VAVELNRKSPSQEGLFYLEAFMKRMGPQLFLEPHEVPNYGQVKGMIIVDAASWAEYALESSGPFYAYTNYRDQLVELIQKKTWRSAAAFDILRRLEREVFVQIEVLEPEFIY